MIDLNIYKQSNKALQRIANIDAEFSRYNTKNAIDVTMAFIIKVIGVMVSLFSTYEHKREYHERSSHFFNRMK